MDLDKITPAPWKAVEEPPGCSVAAWVQTEWQDVCGLFNEGTMADAEFIALARNAFDGDPESLAWWEANRKRSEQ